MAKRLRIRSKKRIRDVATAYKKGTTPAKHKVAVARSRRAKLKKANPMS